MQVYFSDENRKKLEIPTFEISVPVLYFVFRLGLFNLDDAIGMTSGLDLSGYNAPSAGYGAPAPSYNAPTPSYSAPATSYNAPSSSYNSQSISSVSNGAGLTSLTSNSGAYNFRSKEDEAVKSEIEGISTGDFNFRSILNTLTRSTMSWIS